ncbi:13891_t:CDS:2 [Acaulospora colombiana]|uniref:13891_t:CDS:1 n=1 Tax=Acaulospora colombiana TaxID=27376 RepID=A0ACA9LVB8_9GLOM|nr:13891_t:CDS:2 [Acaulospora colombiana]
MALKHGKLKWAEALVNGERIWKQSISGTGHREVSVSVTIRNSSSSYEYQRTVVVAAAHGEVYGFEPGSGEKLWESRLSGCGNTLPSIILDTSSPDVILVGCGNNLYTIDIHNGKTIWKKEISKSFFDSQYTTMATHQSSLHTAFLYTGLNNNPIAQCEEKEKSDSD